MISLVKSHARRMLRISPLTLNIHGVVSFHLRYEKEYALLNKKFTVVVLEILH